MIITPDGILIPPKHAQDQALIDPGILTGGIQLKGLIKTEQGFFFPGIIGAGNSPVIPDKRISTVKFQCPVKTINGLFIVTHVIVGNSLICPHKGDCLVIPYERILFTPENHGIILYLIFRVF
jgi:hypothetical protein